MSSESINRSGRDQPLALFCSKWLGPSNRGRVQRVGQWQWPLAWRKAVSSRLAAIRHIHLWSKHPYHPCPKKPHECSCCKKRFAFPSLLNKHEKKCKLVKVNSKRIVPLVTNKSLLPIKKKYATVPSSICCGIMRDFAKANPTRVSSK